MKCNRCGYDDNGTGDTAHVCFPMPSMHPQDEITRLRAENQLAWNTCSDAEAERDRLRARVAEIDASRTEVNHRADVLSVTIRELRDVVTHSAETKEDFIARVRAILSADPDLRLAEIEARALEEAANYADFMFDNSGMEIAQSLRQLAAEKRAASVTPPT